MKTTPALLLLLTGASLLAGRGAIACNPPPPDAADARPKWHSVTIIPRTNQPVGHFYNKLNPIWWFGNADEPHSPAWYRPNGTLRNVTWYFRNPFANFTWYVIGVADKKTVRSGLYPDHIYNPRGGWNFAVTRRRIVYLPFIDYKRGRFEFYLGWRERGNFGAKLNFRQALPKPKAPKTEATGPVGYLSKEDPPLPLNDFHPLPQSEMVSGQPENPRGTSPQEADRPEPVHDATGQVVGFWRHRFRH